MIHTNRIVTVGEQESIIDKPIVLYRGDREVEIEFTLVGNEFTFSEEGNVIKSVNASHGQLVLNTPSGEHMFSELAECHEGKVVFVVTKEMIDEFIEMGFYSFQIRLYDSAEMKSRVTIPPVMNGFDIRNPIAAEDETNVVDQGIVDYARIFKDQSNEELPTFDWTGEYNKTEWTHHDLITENKLNKIEDALYSINANIKESDVVMLNTLDQVKKDADKYVKEHMAEVEADVEDFERNLNTGVEQFKIDTNAAMTAHKNEVSEELESVNSQLAYVENINKGIVSIKNFGAIGDGVNDDTQAIRAAINYMDTGDELLIPKGTYLITEDIVMPKFVNCRGVIKGGRLIFQQLKEFIVKGLRCNDVVFSGVWRGDVSIINATNIYIDGNVDWFGTYWNNFYIKRCTGVLELDIEKGSINQNRFQGGSVWGIVIKGTNETYSISQAHNNYFVNLDISGGGAIQTDSRMERNYLVNVYCEKYGAIKGNWSIEGFTGDIKPNTTIENNIFNSNDSILRTSHDFLSMTTGNLAVGGEWDDLTIYGVPKCIKTSNASYTVVADNTSPDMSGKSVKIVSNNTTWACFDINFKNAFQGFGGATFYLKGELKTIELINESDYIYSQYHTSVDIGNDWKLYRITLPNDATVTKIRCYLTNATASVNEVYISGIKVLPYKIATLPLASNNKIKGVLSNKPTAGIWDNGDIIINSNITENGEAGWICKDSSTLDFVGIQSKINKLKQEKFFNKTTSSTDKTLFKVSCSSYNEYATIELTVHYYLKSSSSNEYKGFAGIGKYIIALTKEGTLIKQTINPLSEIYQGISGGGITNSLEVTNSGGYWNINITNNNSVSCTCELQYKTFNSTKIVI